MTQYAIVNCYDLYMKLLGMSLQGRKVVVILSQIEQSHYRTMDKVTVSLQSQVRARIIPEFNKFTVYVSAGDSHTFNIGHQSSSPRPLVHLLLK